MTISRVISDVSVINDLLSQGLVTLVGDVLVLLGIVVIMLSMSAPLALLAFAVLPLMLLATWLFTRRAQAAFRETRARVAAVIGGLAEDITGMRVIQAFAQESASEERFDEVNAASRDANIGAMNLSFIFLPSVELISMIATAMVLWFGGRAVAAGDLTLGVVVAFLAYVTRFFQPIQELSQLYTTMQAAMAGGERVLELLDSEPAVRDPRDGAIMPAIRGEIEFRDVSFAYQPGQPVLHDVNLHILPGQTVALVGPTGAGKTSLANLVARFYDVTEGAVLIDGSRRSLGDPGIAARASSGLRPKTRSCSAGRWRTTSASAAPARATKRWRQAAQACQRARVYHAAACRVSDRSVGRRGQPVGRRAAADQHRAGRRSRNPRILILDEATSSVDTVTELLIQEALERLLSGRTALVIAHRLSTIRKADLICVVNEGRIVERGTHEELLAHDGVYRQLVREAVYVAATTDGAESDTNWMSFHCRNSCHSFNSWSAAPALPGELRLGQALDIGVDDEQVA